MLLTPADCYLHPKHLLSGEHVALAEVEWDEKTSLPSIALTFTAKGARPLESATRNFIGHRMAIVLNGAVNFAPLIQRAITGGRARISLKRKGRKGRGGGVCLGRRSGVGGRWLMADGSWLMSMARAMDDVSPSCSPLAQPWLSWRLLLRPLALDERSFCTG